MKTIFILCYNSKYGSDIIAYKTKKKAEEAAEDIRKKWHRKSKDIHSIINDTFGEVSIEIFETDLI